MRRTHKLLIIAALIIAIIVGMAVLRSRTTAVSTPVKTSPSNPLQQLKKGTPDYPTVLPAGKTIDDLGGWTQVSPPEREPVFAYVDRIKDVPISVSQQPLPATFTSNPDEKVRDLALAQNADKAIAVGQRKAYIGTSKNGPQSVIFGTDTLLILIKSSSTIPDDSWKAYLESLR